MKQVTTWLVKMVRWHRTGAALLALFVAVVAGLSVVASASAVGAPMAVAAHSLPAGTVLTEEDVIMVTAPADLLPDGYFDGAADLIGRPLIVGLTRGTPFTTAALSTGGLSDRGTGELLVPFRVQDPDIAALLQVGDFLTIVTSTPEGLVVTVVEHVRVAQLPGRTDGGTWGGSGMSGALIVVAVRGEEAGWLAAVSDQRLGVIIE